MNVLRTPDERFADLPDYPFGPHYVDVGAAGARLRMHYVDEGSGPTVLLLHGEPTWSYLYRHTVAALTAAGLRAVAPDLVGFGRSATSIRPTSPPQSCPTTTAPSMPTAAANADSHSTCAR